MIIDEKGRFIKTEIPVEIIDKIKQLNNDGITREQIGKIVGYGSHIMARLYKDNKIKGIRRKVKLPSIDKDDIERRKAFITYRYNAKKRNLENNLSYEFFSKLYDDKCFYCGLDKSSGVDRVDNKLGYIEDNCVSCCTICNLSKRNLTIEKWEEWLNRIASYRKQ